MIDSNDRVRRTQESYDRIAARFLERNQNRSILRPWFRLFNERLCEGAFVVDLGAGPCHDSAELRELGLNVISVDLNHAMLNVGKEKFPGDRVQADMRRLPFRSRCIAGIWASASLLHLDRADLLPTLQGIRNVLVPSGMLYLSLKCGAGEGWDILKYGPEAPRWFTYWSEDEVDNALRLSGFEVVVSEAQQGPRDRWIMRLVCAGPAPG